MDGLKNNISLKITKTATKKTATKKRSKGGKKPTKKGKSKKKNAKLKNLQESLIKATIEQSSFKIQASKKVNRKWNV